MKGPRDVYYHRALVPTNGQVGWSSSGSVYDGQTDLLAYLAAWNLVDIDVSRQIFRPTTTIRWCGGDEFAQAVQSALETQQAAIRDFVATAREKGAGGLGPVRIEIVLYLEDRRLP